jgi:16S rRNA (uracil1498-N3)-methyltransferase
VAHFYLTDGPLPEVGGIASLTGAEAKHASAVSRIRVGEHLRIGDGFGVSVEGPVTSSSAQLVEVTVGSRLESPRSSIELTLVQALAKGDRDELAVQAATELGVDRIIPWQAARSISRWEGAKAAKGVERWRSIVREATKQSLRPWLPGVNEPVSSRQLVSTAEAFIADGGRVLILAPGGEQTLAEATVDAGSGGVLFVVGPEGGIAPDEIERLVAVGARSVRLGSEVLRTSTAGPAAIAALSVLLGRWS